MNRLGEHVTKKKIPTVKSSENQDPMASEDGIAPPPVSRMFFFNLFCRSDFIFFFKLEKELLIFFFYFCKMLQIEYIFQMSV